MELCSQKLNLAAMSVDRGGGQRWGGQWGPEQRRGDGLQERGRRSGGLRMNTGGVPEPEPVGFRRPIE